MLASAEGVEQMTLAVVGSWSAASPAPSTFCLLLCPWTKPSFSALAAGLLATFLTADAKTGTRWVCLFILNPSDRMSLFRWIASIGIRMMGFSILTCECNQKLMQGSLGKAKLPQSRHLQAQTATLELKASKLVDCSLGTPRCTQVFIGGVQLHQPRSVWLLVSQKTQLWHGFIICQGQAGGQLLPA